MDDEKDLKDGQEGNEPEPKAGAFWSSVTLTGNQTRVDAGDAIGSFGAVSP